MGSQFTSMVSISAASRAVPRAVKVVQHNIVKASTVGYARQEASLVANPFNPNSNSTSGGVTSSPLVSTRDAFVESSVWKSQHRVGYSGTLSSKMTEVELAFPLSNG